MRPSVWLGAAAALAALVLLAIAIGAVPLELRDVVAALTGRGDPIVGSIVRDLRLPRITVALLVGAALGVSGAALQGTLRNPLAEPYLLGVSGGAAVGSVIAVSVGWRGPFAIPLAAFAGASVAIGVVVLIARAVGGRADPRILLMAGVVIGAFANAAIMVVLAGAPANLVRGAVWWMMGSAADATWREAIWLAGYVAAGTALLRWWARDIDVLALGDEPAAALGLDVNRAAQRTYLVASLLAAATVAAAGLIGFVGLIVPHVVRAVGARRHATLLPAAALGGAALVVGADLIARTVRAPAELPLGAITALLGVPFFLAQIRRMT